MTINYASDGHAYRTHDGLVFGITDDGGRIWYDDVDDFGADWLEDGETTDDVTVHDTALSERTITDDDVTDHDDLTGDDFARCDACGDPIDYCHGHGTD